MGDEYAMLGSDYGYGAGVSAENPALPESETQKSKPPRPVCTPGDRGNCLTGFSGSSSVSFSGYGLGLLDGMREDDARRRKELEDWDPTWGPRPKVPEWGISAPEWPVERPIEVDLEFSKIKR